MRHRLDYCLECKMNRDRIAELEAELDRRALLVKELTVALVEAKRGSQASGQTGRGKP